MLRLTAPLTPTALRQAFTEAIDPEMIRDHSHETVIYRRAMRMLASELDCAPTEEDVIRGREGVEPAAHANELLKRSRTGLMILDHGFMGGDGMSQAEHSAAIEIPQREVIRLETTAEGIESDATHGRESNRPSSRPASAMSAAELRVSSDASQAAASLS